jgi:membrane fusion protein, multidrug efflux system
MKKAFLLPIVAVLALAGVFAYTRKGDQTGASNPSASGAPGGGRGGGMRTPMAVEFATVKREAVAEQILVVGNLIGAATVEVVPKVNGRLQSVDVRLGDSVRKGQVIARVEDLELREQVRQAEASFQVGQATIRQREADLKLAKTNLDRSRSLYERQLLPQQTFDDTEARYQAALAQVDLSRAQFEQAKARLEELKITLSNTQIVSPVDGFVGKRLLDPGAFASTNAPVASVVDIRVVRMVANLVERDVRRVSAGTAAAVEVDAFPGEKFTGRVSRVAPVFDPATRTAEMEIEVPNPGFRLKPGMYARVHLTVGSRSDALTVPSAAVVNLDGKFGVFVAAAGEGRQGGGEDRGGSGQPGGDGRQGAGGGGGDTKTVVVRFQPVETGIREGEHVEITSGLQDGARVITTGAGALRDGDRVVPMATQQRGGERADRNGEASRPQRQGSTR